MARMKESAVGLVSALDKERQLEEEALRGMTPEQKEEFKRLLRQGLWEQDKRLRSDYNRQKLIMLAEVQELTRSLQEAEVMGASPEEIAKYQADVSSLSRLLKDESPAFAGALAYQVKKRDLGKAGLARGGKGRSRHMEDLKNNADKIKLVQEAMKKAREIQEAEAAQFDVWKKVQEREALRQDILKKAREKKKRAEEDQKVRLGAPLL